MKNLLTLSALALSVPAIALAQAPEQRPGERDPMQQPPTQPQDRQRSQPQSQQSDRQHSERQKQTGQQQMGQKKDHKRLTRLEQGHIKLNDLEGTSVVNRQDEEIGSIADVVLDRDGRVAAVLITTGGVMGIGDETKALSWDDVQVRAKSDEDDEYEIVVNMSEDELSNLPDFEAERMTTRTTR